MSKSFRRFKRKVRAQSIFSALLWGLGSGLVSLAVVMLVAKLSGDNVQPLYYAIFGGGAVFVTLVLYFLLMPSDKRLAKRLDRVYSLDEKVATMIELKNDNGVFATLQREDADRKLGEKPTRALKSKPLVAGLLVFCIALGSAVGTFVMPAKAESGEAPIDEFDKQWLITAIGELITTVENAYIDDTLKQDVLTELRSLLTFIEGSQLLSEMKAEAIKTVIAINAALKKANSAELIGAELKEISDAEISALGKALCELSGTSSKKALEALGTKVSSSEAADASFVADIINSALDRSGVRSDDALYMLFKSLTSAIKSDYKSADDKFESAAKTLSSTVIVQNVNKATMTIVINKLCSLFGITEDDITAVDPDADVDLRDPSEPEEDPDDSEVEEPEGNMGSGGLGTGDVIYGSNDLVFDPYTGTYRPYGEIINDYFVKANEQITDGKTSDEISDAVEEYFDILFGGANKDN